MQGAFDSTVGFLGDSRVHDTVLYSMIVTSFLAACRRIKNPAKWWQFGWNFVYDWMTGFWSLRSGQQLNHDAHEQPPNSIPPANPAQPQKTP